MQANGSAGAGAAPAGGYGDPVREVGASRDQLRQRFHATLGRTPKQEIDRVRSEKVTELLKRTDWTLERLSEHCGFAGGDELCRFMKRVTGSTPGRIRKG